MKKLTKKQIRTLKSLLLNADGSVKKSFEECLFAHYSKGLPLSVMRSNGFKKSPVVNRKNELIVDVFKALGYSIKEYNDAPRGGVMGEHTKLIRASNVTYIEVIECVVA